ncbi:MAG: hypothetical protein GX786_02720 [Clostridiales bacterium]|nr:hypothetical protein [Clostridiales bacterium]
MKPWIFNHFYSDSQLLRYHQMIFYRKSCRSYTAPPDFSQWGGLSFAAERVCLPGVRIVLAHCDESFFTSPFLGIGRVTGATRFAALIIDEEVPYSLLHSGISAEAFVLEALHQGVSSCWVSGTYKKKENPVKVKAHEKVVAVIALGLAEENPLVSPVKRKGKRFSKDAKGEEHLPSLINTSEAAIEAAPSAMNRQPWKTVYEKNQYTLSSKSPLDMGIALLHSESAFGAHPHNWTVTQHNKETFARAFFPSGLS